MLSIRGPTYILYNTVVVGGLTTVAQGRPNLVGEILPLLQFLSSDLIPEYRHYLKKRKSMKINTSI
jgi:hypothetical protein